MTHTNEYRVMQNPALGSLCLLAFIQRYWNESKRTTGAPFALLPSVLPLTFHRETVQLLHARRFNGGLLNALANDQTFPVGMQRRMEDMLGQTYDAINVGFAARLFKLDTTEYTLVPTVLTRPQFNETPLHQKMFATAERLAYWYRVYPLGQICGYLQLRF
jgi:hypothetical protein